MSDEVKKSLKESKDRYNKIKEDCKTINGINVCNPFPFSSDAVRKEYKELEEEFIKLFYKDDDYAKKAENYLKSDVFTYWRYRLPVVNDYRVHYIGYHKDKEYFTIYCKKLSGDKDRHFVFDGEESKSFIISMIPAKNKLAIIMFSYATMMYVKIYNNENGKMFDDIIKKLGSPSIGWHKDNNSFFYTKYVPRPNTQGPFPADEIYYHVIGKPESEDILIGKFDKTDEENTDYYQYTISVTKNGKHLIVIISSDKRGNLIKFAKIPSTISGQFQFINIVKKWKRKYKYIASVDHKIYLMTDRLAPTGQIVSIDLYNPKPLCHCHPFWETIFESDPYKTIVEAVYINDRLFTTYFFRGKTGLRVKEMNTGTMYTYDDEEEHIKNMSVSPSPSGNYIYYEEWSKCRGPFINRIDTTRNLGKSEDFFKGVEKIDAYEDKFIDREKHIYRSYIPRQKEKLYFVLQSHLSREKLKENKPPCLLIVNGGFGEINFCPSDEIYRVFNGLFGASVASCYIPGGLEFGRDWQNKGKRKNKIVGIKYIKDAIELIKDEYGSDKIIIYGQHNGATIAAAFIQKYPENVVGAILEDGIFNLIDIKEPEMGMRFIEEYGDAEKDAKHVEDILKLSPLHRLKSTFENINVKSFPWVYVVYSRGSAIYTENNSLSFLCALKQKILNSKFNETPILYKNIDATYFDYCSLPIPYTTYYATTYYKDMTFSDFIKYFAHVSMFAKMCWNIDVK